MKAIDMVFEMKKTFKEEICKILVKRYLELHNGEFPNWENDEDIRVYEEDIDKTDVNYFHIKQYDTYDEYCEVVKTPINSYIVTLDSNLYFTLGDEDNEYEWYEISVEDLANLFDYLTAKFKRYESV